MTRIVIIRCLVECPKCGKRYVIPFMCDEVKSGETTSGLCGFELYCKRCGHQLVRYRARIDYIPRGRTDIFGDYDDSELHYCWVMEFDCTPIRDLTIVKKL